MVRQNNLCDRYQSFVQSHLHGVSTAIGRAVRTVSLCSETYKAPPPAGVVDIIYKMRDLESFEGGMLYRHLIEALEESNGNNNGGIDSDYETPTACSSEPGSNCNGNDVLGYPSSIDASLELEEQPQQPVVDQPPPPAGPPRALRQQQNFLERQRQRAKRAFLSAVFIEGHKQASIDDLRETLRRHYVLGRDPFCYDAHTHEPTGIGTKTIVNVLPSIHSASARTLATAATPTTSNAQSCTSIVVLYYYIF